ncbi:hypothetical protein ACFQAT_28595 [Undibacterium arcticum]|uniref:hypothetical protein n=1 Tax=Undibacterium arcticum TaxID=1762892 RepID=UPI00360F7EA4
MKANLVLYVYKCAKCGYNGEMHLPGDGHAGESATCTVCGAVVTLEWDGGVTFQPNRPHFEKRKQPG